MTVPRPATACAVSYCEILTLHRSTLHKVIRHFPGGLFFYFSFEKVFVLEYLSASRNCNAPYAFALSFYEYHY